VVVAAEVEFGLEVLDEFEDVLGASVLVDGVKGHVVGEEDVQVMCLGVGAELSELGLNVGEIEPSPELPFHAMLLSPPILRA